MPMPLNQQCSTPEEIARHNESLILQMLLSNGQKPIAEVMQVEESTISKMKSAQGNNRLSQIQFFSEMLAHLGLRVVKKDQQCYEPEVINAMFTLMKHGIVGAENPYGFFQNGGGR